MRASCGAVPVVLAAAVLGLLAPSARAATPESAALKDAKASIKLRLGGLKTAHAGRLTALANDLALLLADFVDGTETTEFVTRDMVDKIVEQLGLARKDSEDAIINMALDIKNVYGTAALPVPGTLLSGGADADKARAQVDAANAKLTKKVAGLVKKFVANVNKKTSTPFRIAALILPFPPMPAILASQTLVGSYGFFSFEVYVLAAGSTGVATEGVASAGGMQDQTGHVTISFGATNFTDTTGTGADTWQQNLSGLNPLTFQDFIAVDTNDSVLLNHTGIGVPAP